MSRKPLRLLIACAFSLLAAAPQLQLRNYERYKPYTVPQHPPSAQPPIQYGALPEQGGDDKVLVEELRGIIVLDSPDMVDAEDDHKGTSGLRYDVSDATATLTAAGFEAFFKATLAVRSVFDV